MLKKYDPVRSASNVVSTLPFDLKLRKIYRDRSADGFVGGGADEARRTASLPRGRRAPAVKPVLRRT
jgi:hypothetical protein